APVVDRNGTANQLTFVDKTEHAAIVAVAAMVTHREHHAGRHDAFVVRPAALVVIGLRREPELRLVLAEMLHGAVAERLTVDRQLAVEEGDAIPADCDDAFDESCRAVLR